MEKITKILIFFAWLIFFIINIGVAVYLIVIANGYRIDWENFKIEKTGIIYLKSTPNDVNIYIDNKIVGDKTPFKYQEVLPGRYSVSISGYNRQDWQGYFVVEPGIVSSKEKIVLFLKKPEEMPLSNEDVTYFEKNKNNENSKSLIIKNNSEIYSSDKLVTRFSESVKKAVWYPDYNHIVFQVDKELRVMEVDGSNNIKLLNLESADPIELVFSDQGRIIILKDDILKKFKIS